MFYAIDRGDNIFSMSEEAKKRAQIEALVKLGIPHDRAKQ